MEKFDLVDKDDNVVGVTNKAQSHAQGIIHRVAAIFIFSDDTNLYVQVHEGSNGILDSTVGGHVQASETYLEGATREMAEEVGLDTDLDFVGNIYSDETYTGSNYRHMYGLFTAKAPKDWSFQPTEEVKKLLLTSLSDLLNSIISNPKGYTAGFIRCMMFYCEQKEIPFAFDLNSYKELRLRE